MKLIQMSLSGAVMILVIAFLRAMFVNRLPKRTFLLLWALALVRLLVPYTFPSAFSVYSMINRIEPVKEEVVKLPPILFSPPQAVSTVPSPAAPPQVTAPVSVEPQPVNLWAVIWLVGAALCLIWFALSYFRCRREFRSSRPVCNDFTQHWLKAHILRRPIEIRQSTGISAPLTYGVLRPVILMPKDTNWEDIDTLRYVLEHEYIHIRRFDAASKLFFTTALCVHWFNPAVWLMYILVNRDMELSCDEAVIHLFGQNVKSNYAMTLIHMEEIKSGLTPLANGFSKNAIEERITAIMKTKKITLWISAIALVLVAGTAILFATSPKEEMPELIPDDVPALETIAVPAGLLEKLSVELSPNITRQTVSDTRDEFVRDGQVIGGIVVMNPSLESVPGITDSGDLTQSDNLHAWANDVEKLVNYLESNIIEGLTPADYDYYMSGSDKYALVQVECGTRDRFFTHYIYQGNSAFYDVWFEDPLSNTGEVQMITASVHSEDIPQGADSGPFSLNQVQEISFENLTLPEDSWDLDALKELWAAVHADMSASAMTPDASRHSAQFHFTEGSAAIFQPEAHDAPYILLALFTDGDSLTFQIYPECENVMAWMAERDLLQEIGASVIDVGWGLSFETVEADTTHITVRATQSGGTQLGQLQLEYCRLSPLILTPNSDIPITEEIVLKKDDVTEFTFFWPESWDALPAMDYELLFYVKDTGAQEPDQILRRGYKVAFTLPE